MGIIRGVRHQEPRSHMPSRVWLVLLFLMGGCQTDHRKNCEDLCKALVECGGERACQYVVDDDVKACRKQCVRAGSTFDLECTACLATEFSCDEPVNEDCEEACIYTDYVGSPPEEWFCDGEPLVPNP